MSTQLKRIAYHRVGQHLYPANHWSELKRFVSGKERDPKGLFRLSDDLWETWRYAANGRPTEAKGFRLRFGNLSSFLKPYVKCYCYHRVIGRGGVLRRGMNTLIWSLGSADRYITDHGLATIDEIASPTVFDALWASLVTHPVDEDGLLPHAGVVSQEQTRPFWVYLRAQFGSPEVVPPIAPHKVNRPVAFAADETKIIPTPVIKQLVNKLALHRKGQERLNRFHHLRLCVLILIICLGRRVDEVLASRRGSGAEGPLSRYPARDGAPEGALWFRFSPNKRGPAEYVYISPEWEDIASYCVSELLRYSDEVRKFAAPEEQDLLILISPCNWTSGPFATNAIILADDEDLANVRAHGGTVGNPRKRVKERATALSYQVLRKWLSGRYNWENPNEPNPGILELWNITEDGSPDGPVYKFRTNYARHTRQSALALDAKTPLLIKQRDLNHTDRDMQFAYQHRLSEQNEALMEKMGQGRLLGNGVRWLNGVFAGEGDGERDQPGCSIELPPRWRALIEDSQIFRQTNRVPGGFCVLPQGPAGCEEFMRCTEAQEGGCYCFVTDPEDELMLIELAQRARAHREEEQKSETAGHLVRAGKYEVLARRTEMLHDEAMCRASRDVLDRLKKVQLEMEGEGNERAHEPNQKV